MKRPLIPCSIALIGAYIAGGARSGLIVDNGPPDKLHGWEMVEYFESDDFVLAEPTRLESVTFWDFEDVGYFAGSIYWEVHSDSGNGGPGPLLFSGTSTSINHLATGSTIFGAKQEFVNTFSIVPVSLPRGTYWLALHNGPLSNATGDPQNAKHFYWENSGTDQGLASHHKFTPFAGLWYLNSPPDLSFQLNGVAAPSAVSVARSQTAAQINFPTTAGYFYRVDYKNKITDGFWTPVSGAEIVAGSGNVVQITDPGVNGGTPASRFYRVALTYNIPRPAAPALKFNGSKPQIGFSTLVGYYYRVEYKDNLVDPAWKPVSGAETIAGTGGLIQITDLDSTLGTQSARFYRVILF